MTLNELIRELQEIRSQTEDYDMGALPVEVYVNDGEYIPDVTHVEVTEQLGHPYYVRLYAS